MVNTWLVQLWRTVANVKVMNRIGTQHAISSPRPTFFSCYASRKRSESCATLSLFVRWKLAAGAVKRRTRTLVVVRRVHTGICSMTQSPWPLSRPRTNSLACNLANALTALTLPDAHVTARRARRRSRLFFSICGCEGAKVCSGLLLLRGLHTDSQSVCEVRF